jgi:hypothetical protein
MWGEIVGTWHYVNDEQRSVWVGVTGRPCITGGTLAPGQKLVFNAPGWHPMAVYAAPASIGDAHHKSGSVKDLAQPGD